MIGLFSPLYISPIYRGLYPTGRIRSLGLIMPPIPRGLGVPGMVAGNGGYRSPASGSDTDCPSSSLPGQRSCNRVEVRCCAIFLIIVIGQNYCPILPFHGDLKKM